MPCDNGQIWCGNPLSYYEDKERLHNLVNEAIHCVSGLQQPDHPQSKEEAVLLKEERAAAERYLRKTTEKIVNLLMGEKFIIVEGDDDGR